MPKVSKAEKLQAQLDTKSQQLLALETEINSIRAELDLIKAVQKLKMNDVVSFSIGRGETRQVVTGTVLAVYDVQGGSGTRKVKVFHGEGPSADVKEISPSSI